LRHVAGKKNIQHLNLQPICGICCLSVVDWPDRFRQQYCQEGWNYLRAGCRNRRSPSTTWHLVTLAKDKTMKFMCLVCLDADMARAMTQEDWRSLDRDSLGYDGVLAEKGNYITSQALQDIGTAMTVRVRKGEALVTDGPYVETKEHVAGFILVEARDMAEAVELAKGIPLARVGSVEVRPVMTIARQ
jgi:hypothetical protein